VVETRAVVGVADVHAGAFADRIEAFEHLDGIGAVIVNAVGLKYRFVGHENRLSIGQILLEKPYTSEDLKARPIERNPRLNPTIQNCPENHEFIDLFAHPMRVRTSIKSGVTSGV
jgi:hypothetical protein